MGSVNVLILCTKEGEIKSIFKVARLLLPCDSSCLENAVEETEVRDLLSCFTGQATPSRESEAWTWTQKA